MTSATAIFIAVLSENKFEKQNADNVRQFWLIKMFLTTINERQ